MDEFQNFTTLAVANMLADLRKYGLGMVLAHQYLGQLDPAVRDAVLGNAGTLVSFRLAADDAIAVGREFAPIFSAHDLTNLPNRQFYLRLLIDGQPSSAFSAATIEVK